jgi:hypothetical protein
MFTMFPVQALRPTMPSGGDSCLWAPAHCRVGQQTLSHVSIPCAGIAPYRAFWRRFFLEDVPNYKFGGLAWLFMGVANSDAKLYDDELQMLVKEYPKQVHSSLSRGCSASVMSCHLMSSKSCQGGSQAGLPPDSAPVHLHSARLADEWVALSTRPVVILTANVSALGLMPDL